MREILFRGKSGNRWLYGDAHTDYNGVVSTIIVPTMCWKTETIETQCAGYFGVEPNTVTQYTGLTDKKGNKIFENDIISSDNNTFVVTWLEDKAKFVCKFIDGTDIYCDLSDKYIKDFFVVVGNIYDNPELLD